MPYVYPKRCYTCGALFTGALKDTKPGGDTLCEECSNKVV